MNERFRAEMAKNRKKEWIWRIVAANGRKVAVGGEGYKNRGDCLRMLELAMTGFGVQSFEDLVSTAKLTKKKRTK